VRGYPRVRSRKVPGKRGNLPRRQTQVPGNPLWPKDSWGGKEVQDNLIGTEEEIDHVDTILLGEAIERFKRKLHFSAKLLLSRPQTQSHLWTSEINDSFDVSSQLDSSYNLTKIQEEKEDLVQDILEGDIRSLLQFQSETIGHSVDSFFLNVFCCLIRG